MQILVIEGLHPFFDKRVAELVDFKVRTRLWRTLGSRDYSETDISAQQQPSARCRTRERESTQRGSSHGMAKGMLRTAFFFAWSSHAAPCLSSKTCGWQACTWAEQAQRANTGLRRHLCGRQPTT